MPVVGKLGSVELCVGPTVRYRTLVEPVHPPVVPRLARARVAMRDVLGADALVGPPRERPPHASVVAVRNAVGARERAEQVVERAVLLDQEDDVLDRPPSRVPLVRPSCRHRRLGGRSGARQCGGPRRRRVPFGRGGRAACRGDQREDDPSGKQWPADPRCRPGRGARTHHHIADSVYPSDVPYLDSPLPVPLLRSILVQDALTLNASLTPSRGWAAWLLARRAVCFCRSSTASRPWTSSRTSAAPLRGLPPPLHESPTTK